MQHVHNPLQSLFFLCLLPYLVVMTRQMSLDSNGSTSLERGLNVSSSTNTDWLEMQLDGTDTPDRTLSMVVVALAVLDGAAW
jgi:hypothetical protein